MAGLVSFYSVPNFIGNISGMEFSDNIISVCKIDRGIRIVPTLRVILNGKNDVRIAVF